MDNGKIEALRAAAEQNVTVRDFLAVVSPAEVRWMLDTISALTERAERAERERDEERHLATVRGEMLTRAEAEVSRLRAAMPTDRERSSAAWVIASARMDADAPNLRDLHAWLARLDAARKDTP